MQLISLGTASGGVHLFKDFSFSKNAGNHIDYYG